MFSDIINGMFEIFGSLFVWRSIFLLYKQKKVHGVSFLTIGFFSIWGFWNLYYYPSLDQYISFIGGINITIANTIWLSQIIYYNNKNKNI